MELHYLGALVTSNPSHVVWATAQRSSLTRGRLPPGKHYFSRREGWISSAEGKEERSEQCSIQAGLFSPDSFPGPSPVLGPRRGRGPGC